MNDLNHNIFSNKNEILKSEFDGLVKTHDLEVFVEKALHNYLKTIKSGLKNDEELQTTTELLHLHPIIIVTEKGIKGRVFYRSIYDLEKAECTGTNFEKGGLPEGTIKDWKNGKFIKQGEKWVPYKPSENIKPNRGNEVLTVSKTPITIKQFDRYFLNNYGYISHSLSEKEVEKFINKHKDKSIEKVADLFSDYLLSQGLADAQL